MAVSAGTRLGPHEILSHIGSGGMGEVHRARDTRLGREVAIKVLPETFARDPERLARFRREAHLLASLNHPNIAAIYGLEDSGNVHYLVLEYVPGETLAERVRRGPVEVEEALRIAAQIAEALEAAHEKAVVHRDLKPANVKVTPEGKVKVLDFGLAKALAEEATGGDPGDSPTITAMPTQPGVILGTAAYMSPEQARGKRVDKRTDIWAFGCVLYELLTGGNPFSKPSRPSVPRTSGPRGDRKGAVARPADSPPLAAGLPHSDGDERGSDSGEPDTVTEILARILQAEPDWDALPANTPLPVRALLRRCLQKDRDHRLRDAGDARIEIKEALAASATTVPGPALTVQPRAVWRWALLSGLACLLLGGVIAGLTVGTLRPAPAPQPVSRFVIPLPPSESLTLRLQPSVPCPTLALSPDGSLLAYVSAREGREQLYLCALDNLEPRVVSGVEREVDSLFFSPDGQWLGFWADGKLKKAAISGGAAVTLATGGVCGGSWGAGDIIVFTQAAGLWKVSASGGTPETLASPESEKGEAQYVFPEFLPGGRAVLFTILPSSGNYDDAQIVAQRLDTGERKVLLQGGSNAKYTPTGPSSRLAGIRTGHLVCARAGVLLAAPFDLERLEVTGSPVPLVEGVIRSANGFSHFTVSSSGSLVYVPGGVSLAAQTLVWVDRTGAVQPLGAPARPYAHPQFSPDGRQLAVTIEGAKNDVWVYDLSRGTLTRLTFEGSNQNPLWTPDGKRIVFRSDRAAFRYLFWKPADGSGAEEQITKVEGPSSPSSISPDGKVAFYSRSGPTTGRDMWSVPLEGERKPSLLLQTPFEEAVARISPDGRWLAYLSNESGRWEVYVRPFPGPGGKWQVSTEGGEEPLWSRNGRELFYRNDDKMMAVDISTEPSFRAGTPRLLFAGKYAKRAALAVPNFDVAPDGQRFLMVKATEQQSTATQIHVVLNWFEELKRHVPTTQ